MNDVVDQQFDARRIWLRGFYGFGPEDAGYIGFSKEAERETMIARMSDGDLVLIYGVSNELTSAESKNQALGFLEISRERCFDRERSSQSAIDWKIHHKFSNRWTFGLKVRKAWRFRNRVNIKTIAPLAFASSNRFERTKRAILLADEERDRALSHTVYQVNVYGEQPISNEELATGAIGELLRPSRGIPPSVGTRASTYEDGENNLYLMMLEGGAEALLGRTGVHVGKALVKVGRSNEPARRLKEINGGFPERAVCRWKIAHTHTFPDAHTAHRYEEELKALFTSQFRSEGGEFFTVTRHADAELEFQRFCANRSAIIRAAPGRAKGVK